MLEAIKEEGIEGIECYYPTHSEALTKTCLEFCEKYDLLITTGSDEHGEFGKETKTLEQTIGCLGIDESKVKITPLLK